MTTNTLKVRKKNPHVLEQQTELMQMVGEEDDVRVFVRVPKSVRMALKIKTTTEGTSIQEVLRGLVDEYLKR